MDAKHLPWVTGVIGTKGGLGPDCNDAVCAILRHDGGLVAEGFSADESAHIVLCVNAHEELVQALRECVAELEAFEAPRDPLDSHNVRLSLAKAALRKVLT